MASPPSFYKEQFAIDTITWTRITTTIDAVSIGIKNMANAAMKIRTDTADLTSEDTIPAGVQEVITGPMREIGNAVRFKAGDTVCFLQAVSGTGPAMITFVG